jgi:hypothetical protein
MAKHILMGTDLSHNVAYLANLGSAYLQVFPEMWCGMGRFQRLNLCVCREMNLGRQVKSDTTSILQ